MCRGQMRDFLIVITFMRWRGFKKKNNKKRNLLWIVHRASIHAAITSFKRLYFVFQSKVDAQQSFFGAKLYLVTWGAFTPGLFCFAPKQMILSQINFAYFPWLVLYSHSIYCKAGTKHMLSQGFTWALMRPPHASRRQINRVAGWPGAARRWMTPKRHFLDVGWPMQKWWRAMNALSTTQRQQYMKVQDKRSFGTCC